MQLKWNQFQQHLTQTLTPIYWVQGDEVQLRQEIRLALRDKASQRGLNTEMRFFVDAGFDWDTVWQAAQPSLFSGPQLFDIQLLQKPDASMQKMLAEQLKNLSAQHIWLFSSEKLNKSQLQSTWFKWVDQQGVLINLWPLSPAEWRVWLKQHASECKIQLTESAQAVLQQLTTGNLTTCYQTLTKLRLLYPDTCITPELLREACHDQAQFTLFDLGRFILSGQAPDALRILRHLQHTHIETPLVLWQLTQIIRQGLQHLQQRQQGVPVSQLLTHEWGPQKTAWEQALQRFSIAILLQGLQRAQQIDCLIKTQSDGRVWDGILELVILLAQGKQLSHPVSLLHV